MAKRKKASSTRAKSKTSSRGKPNASKKRMPSRYNQVQKILGEYVRSQGLKLGRDFNRLASKINKATAGDNIKYVGQNIDAIFKIQDDRVQVVKQFTDNIEFWGFKEALQLPIYDGAKVGYEFDDGYEQYSTYGDKEDTEAEFLSSGFYKYLRNNYNGSPPNNATFVIVDTDNKSYVKYKVQTFAPPSAGVEPPKAPKEPVGAPKSAGVASPYTAEETIAIEREKQKTFKEQQKTLKEVQKLLKQGFTKDEIMRILGK